MATERPNERFDGPERYRRPVEQEESIRGRVRGLAEDSADLVRQEINLAKLEMKELGSQFAQDAVKIGIAAGVAAVGALALTTFLILVIGLLLDGAFWAGALIVGAVFLLIGGLLAKNAIDDLREREWKPDETMETLKEDQRFAKSEANDFRRRMTG